MGRLLQLCTASEFLQFTAPLLRAIAEAGAEVHVCCSPGEELDEIAAHPGIKVHELPLARGIDARADAVALPRLHSLMRRVKPDLVHVHTPKAGLLGMLAASAARVPARIYQMHGLRYEVATGGKRALLEASDRLSCALAHRVVCVSHSVKERALSDKLVQARKALILAEGGSSGIDGHYFSPRQTRAEEKKLRAELGIAPGAPCLGFIGRLAKDKGLAELTQSFLELRKERPNLQLLLAGREDETDPADLSVLRGTPGVHFLGLLRDPRPFYSLATVIVLPSYREGLPQVILEAGAMQTPVVGTNVTGIVDVVRHEKTGLLVPARDFRALSSALERLLDSPQERTEMGSAARSDLCRRFEPARLVQETLSLYREMSPAFR